MFDPYELGDHVEAMFGGWSEELWSEVQVREHLTELRKKAAAVRRATETRARRKALGIPRTDNHRATLRRAKAMAMRPPPKPAWARLVDRWLAGTKRFRLVPRSQVHNGVIARPPRKSEGTEAVPKPKAAYKRKGTLSTKGVAPAPVVVRRAGVVVGTVGHIADVQMGGVESSEPQHEGGAEVAAQAKAVSTSSR